MAAATAVTSRRGNDQFRGLFTDTWDVTCTLDAADLGTGATATDTVAVPGVALGDMVLGFSNGVSEAGLVKRAYVSAANVVTIVTYNPTAGSVNLASTTLQLVIGRAVL
jgi:hypothetical protein